MQKIKIPTLMYHEVSEDGVSLGSQSHMTPTYHVPERLFENQMRWLAEKEYRSIFFDEIRNLGPDGKYAIITFDDGLAGNSKVALPILKKYGFKAVFFVTVGFIGKPLYMDWDDLRVLVDHGMSIQSHTMSHPHLPELSESEMRWELMESKVSLEKSLKTKVDALSFPHGSYDKRVIRIAADQGYLTMCSSEVTRNCKVSFYKDPVVIGRLTVTSRLSQAKFIRMVDYHPLEIAKEQLVKGTKNSFKRIIGTQNYGKLYRLFFKIHSSS